MPSDDARARRTQDELAAAVVLPRAQTHLLESISDAVVAIDDHGVVTYFGPGAEALYGVAASEMIGRPLEASHSYRWHSREEEQEAWAALERTGRWNGRNVHVLRSGEERHVHSTVTVLRDDVGERIGLLAVIRDVTADVENEQARRQAEEARRASEVLYRSVVRGLLESIFIFEPVLDGSGELVDVVIRDANETAASQMGYSATALLGGRGMELFGAAAMRPFIAKLAEVHRTGVPSRWETTFEWNSRRYIASAQRLPDGNLVALGLDVTELRKSDERLRLALRAGHVGIWEYDIARGLVEWTDETYALMGLPSGKFGGSPEAFFELVHPDDRALVREHLADVLQGKDSVYTCEYRVRRPDGSIRWCADMARVVRDAEGVAVRMAGTIRDVTEERLAQAALIDADRRKTEFLAVLSHELRNPLAPIRNSVALLDSVPPDSAAAKRAREILRRQAEHLSRLVDDLLDLSRITHGKMVVELAPADARELVRRAYLDAKVLFDARGVELKLSDPVEPLWIEADAARFAQLLGNLLHNALKFTPPRGLVQLEVGRRGSTCEVRVTDSGQGLEAADLERIFDPFEQAARSRDGVGGLGLGLALVKRLAAKHHGTVCARSEGPGRGAEFVLALPLVPAPMPIVEPAATRRGTTPLSILVVEDNEDAATTLADLLGLGGHRVSTAGTGRRGVEMVALDPPDVLICDVGLPDMSGHDVIRAVRAGVDGSRVFAVALTGYAQPQDRDEALAAGFDAHLAKPPPLEELDALLSEASRRQSPARE